MRTDTVVLAFVGVFRLARASKHPGEIRRRASGAEEARVSPGPPYPDASLWDATLRASMTFAGATRGSIARGRRSGGDERVDGSTHREERSR